MRRSVDAWPSTRLAAPAGCGAPRPLLPPDENYVYVRITRAVYCPAQRKSKGYCSSTLRDPLFQQGGSGYRWPLALPLVAFCESADLAGPE